MNAIGRRIVVTGATGNVGTSVVQALSEDPATGSVLGLARRKPDLHLHKVDWAAADLSEESATDELARHFEGADAVIHLAWRFQPTHDPVVTWQSNVLGSLRVFDAVARARVPALIHASSVGAYSPGPSDDPGRRVDESWPTHGWPEASYCVEKADLERVLEHWEQDHPEVRVVRMRPAFLFKQSAAGEQLRIFAGRFLPGPLVRPDLLPVVPTARGLQFQALHTEDVAQAYRLAVERDVRGPFNLAAEPVVDGERLGELLGARVAGLPPAALRAALTLGWSLRAVNASPQLFGAVMRLPLMDCSRAHEELGWQPRYDALRALRSFLTGAQNSRSRATAPLAGHAVR